MKYYKMEYSKSTKIKSRYWQFKFALQPIVKRLLDLVFATLAALLLLPLLMLIALLIKADSRGPVFFRQQRVGLNGACFEMWKFRSMLVDAEQLKDRLESKNEMQNGVLFKIKQDPRVTRVGRYIRKLSIDELPQLFNVIRGDMSLVGPRPPLVQEVAQYTRSDRRRLMVVPGLTCIWQVCGRSDIPFDEQVELDVQYIESQSIWLDIVLLMKTVPAVLTARGAY